MSFTRSLSLVLVAWLCVACGREQPTAPSILSGSQPANPSSSLQTFSVSGTVTDEQGLPISGVPVVMRHFKPSCCSTVTAVTDAAGRYAVEFQSTSHGPYAARAELIVDGYDWYYRNVQVSSLPIVENFRLNRVTRIAAGEAVVIALTPENGSCLGFLYEPCGRLRVTVPEDGELTLEGAVTEGGLSLPLMEVCCEGGNERGGNPVTLPVKAGIEIWVEVGQQPRGSSASAVGRVRVSTSFKRL